MARFCEGSASYEVTEGDPPPGAGDEMTDDLQDLFGLVALLSGAVPGRARLGRWPAVREALCWRRRPRELDAVRGRGRVADLNAVSC